MTTSTITGSIIDGSGTPLAGVTVRARLRGGPAYRWSDGTSISDPAATTTDGTGAYSFALERQANISPNGATYWEIEEARPASAGGPQVETIRVGSGDSTVAQSRVVPLALLGPAALTQELADARYERLASFTNSVQYVASGGDDTASGLTWGEAKGSVAAAIAALPKGASDQPVGDIIVGAGTFTTSATLELGYGTAAGTGGFSLVGLGKGITKLVYTGSGSGMQFANRGTAEQKWVPSLDKFTFVAASAAVAIDFKGATYGTPNIEVIGAASLGAVVAGSVGIKWDGSYSGSIGAWWNDAKDCRVSGFETCYELTGTAGSGQANENTLHKCRAATYTRCGIDVDEGDNVVIDNCDVTTGTPGTVPTVAGIRVNGLAIKVRDCRFENIGSGGICVLVDGAGSKPGDRCVIEDNAFDTESGSIAIKLATNSGRTSIHDNQYASGVTPVVDNGTATTTQLSVYGMAGNPNLVPLVFAVTSLAANRASAAIDAAGGATTRYFLSRPYQVRGMTTFTSTAVTAGAITAKVTITGVEGTLTCTHDSTPGTTGSAWQKMGIDTNGGGSAIGVNVATNSGFLPDGTAGLTVILWVEFTG